jgi:hypothetical protein
MNGYLVDTSIFIASNRNYRQEFFPVVWKFFLNTSHLYMLDRVYNELIEKPDDLSIWAKKNWKDSIIIADTFVNEYRQVADYLRNSGLWSSAGYEQWTRDYTKADPWLIACAMNQGYTIVTCENNVGPNGKVSSQEPKIPFVAQHMGVKTMDFWHFLAAEHFKALP